LLSLTSMITTLAQLKNLRRGHDAQGRLKQLNLKSSTEGYANFMAPMRVKQIAQKISDARKKAQEAKDLEEDARLKDIYNTDILKPGISVYMTPEWNEMVPFPTSKFQRET
jgi:hypothetical protein